MEEQNTEEILGTLETTLGLPAAGLYVNVDFNDLLAEMGELPAFELLGKLKDLFA